MNLNLFFIVFFLFILIPFIFLSLFIFCPSQKKQQKRNNKKNIDFGERDQLPQSLISEEGWNQKSLCNKYKYFQRSENCFYYCKETPNIKLSSISLIYMRRISVLQWWTWRISVLQPCRGPSRLNSRANI